MTVDDGLEDKRWICCLGGETLPAVSYAIPQNDTKGALFAIGEISRVFPSVFYTPMEKCLCTRRLPGAAMYHRQCCEHCVQRVGRCQQLVRPASRS